MEKQSTREHLLSTLSSNEEGDQDQKSVSFTFSSVIWLSLGIVASISVYSFFPFSNEPSSVNNIRSLVAITPQALIPKACNGGFYSSTDAMTCVPCPAGSYNDDQVVVSFSCKTCPDGTYSPIIGAQACIPCWSTTYPNPSKTACTRCPIGLVNAPGSIDASSCVATCPANLQKTMDFCACNTGEGRPSNDLYIQGISEKMLRVNTVLASFTRSFYNGYGFSTTECAPCFPGYTYVPKNLGFGDGNGLDQCKPLCAKGSVWSTVTNSCVKSCSDPNMQMNNFRLDSKCQCKSGYYLDSTSGSCSVCPMGFSCLTGRVAPMVCIAGTFSGVGSDTCTSCPIDHYCPIQSSAPIVCPVGTYAPQNARSATDCQASYTCPTGFIFRSPASYTAWKTSTCLTCKSGYFYDSSVLDTTAPGLPCTPGSFCSLCTTAPTSCSSIDATKPRSSFMSASSSDCYDGTQTSSITSERGQITSNDIGQFLGNAASKALSNQSLLQTAAGAAAEVSALFGAAGIGVEILTSVLFPPEYVGIAVANVEIDILTGQLLDLKDGLDFYRAIPWLINDPSTGKLVLNPKKGEAIYVPGSAIPTTVHIFDTVHNSFNSFNAIQGQKLGFFSSIALMEIMFLRDYVVNFDTSPTSWFYLNQFKPKLQDWIDQIEVVRAETKNYRLNPFGTPFSCTQTQRTGSLFDYEVKDPYTNFDQTWSDSMDTNTCDICPPIVTSYLSQWKAACDNIKASIANFNSKVDEILQQPMDTWKTLDPFYKA